MVKSSKRSRISKSGPKPNKSLTRGADPIQSEAPLTFDFSKQHWLKSISQKEFSNKLRDETMFAQYIFEIFNRIIPTIQVNWISIFRNGGRGSWEHCHQVDDNKLDLVLNIIEETHGHKFEQEQVGSSLWQLGVTQNIRIIAVYNYNNNFLTPVFVDYHHLIYPNKHFNQNDINQYPFCPYDEYCKK